MTKQLFAFAVIFLFFTAKVFSQSNSFAGATLISSTVTTNTCVTGTNSFTNQTYSNATNEPGTTITGNACGSSNGQADVWYKFTARTEYPDVTVTPTGGYWTTTNQLKIQILSGSALGSLVQVACGSSPGTGTVVNTPIVVYPSPTNALTIGADYYVRISKGTGTAPGVQPTATFNICLTNAARGSRMSEIFKKTVLSTNDVLNYPWEVTYGNDNNLWVTEARGYKLNKINPTTGAKTVVLDLSNNSTWLTTNGAPAGSDSLAVIHSTTAWTGGWPSGTSSNPSWPQGGFAGMAMHPRFGDGSGNDYVYVTYVHRYLNGGGTTTGVRFRNKLVRFTYNSGTQKLSMPAILHDSLPGSSDHNSQRLIIAPVGGTNYLFMASGDMGAGQFGNRDRIMNAQNKDSLDGKILRFNLISDGDAGGLAWIPNDNPYGAANPVWCVGMRNNQGFAYNAADGILYGTSHGPYSDDELNIIQGFKNYGHPLVIGYASDGNYNGNSTAGTYTSISAGTGWNSNSGNSTCPPIGNEVTNMNTLNSLAIASVRGAYVDPIFSAYAPINGTDTTTGNEGTIRYIWGKKNQPGNETWPSEGWSGLDIYTNSIIPGWKKTLTASGLKWGRLIRMKLNTSGTNVTPFATGTGVNEDTITYFQSGNRYRDMAFAPNGKDIFLVMDNSSATSGPGIGNPTVPACPGCLIKYTFLGYADDGSGVGKSTIPTTIDVSTSTATNTCITANSVTIDASNNQLWVPITGPDGNIVAEINANGNNLGNVTASYFQRTGGIRTAGSVKYLDRNITITPTVQPTLPVGSPLVKIRLYFTKAEYDALDANATSGVNAITDVKILKNNDACGSTVATATTLINPTVQAAHGANGYVLQGDISSFSSFYFASSLITLPLDLITFKGSLQSNGSALLQWKTTNEVNTSHFVIERSNDGNNFNSIGQENASGYTTIAKDYEFTDADASLQTPPTVYYRLKMVDRDGKYTYSNVVTISLGNIAGKVWVYPNPARNEVTTEIVAAASGTTTLQIVDNSGRMLMSSNKILQKGRNTFTINIDKLSSGVYYLKVTGGEFEKMVKIQKL